MIEGLLIGAAATAVAAAAQMFTKGKWKAVASDLGLELSSSFFSGQRIQGRLRDFGVEIRQTSDESGTGRIVIEVDGVDPGFTLGRDNALIRMMKTDIQTGDQLFDQRTRIEGNEACALALLGHEARRLTDIVVSKSKGKLAERKLQASVAEVRKAPAVLARMLDLAHLLRRPLPDEIPGLLAERAQNDLSNGVRLHAFRLLASSFHRSSEVRSTATELLTSPNTELRLEACRALLRGEESERTLAAQELAQLALHRHLDSATRRVALESLSPEEFREIAVPTMAQLLEKVEDHPAEIRRVALDGLIRARATAELLAVEPSDDPAEAERLARGLGHLGDSAVQPRLLLLLNHPEDSVRTAAAQALGAVGDPGAVGALRKIASASSLFKSALARAAETAIQEIKSRAGGTQAGEISIATTAEVDGALSHADEVSRSEGGEVSLTS
ncbi:MAG: HEAT repeat domain-containing protein [Thermoanaerobaculia bacterium]|nr:HEAT repeat domain-containing protein [Thermoanaerobaculia bacterium]